MRQRKQRLQRLVLNRKRRFEANVLVTKRPLFAFLAFCVVLGQEVKKNEQRIKNVNRDWKQFLGLGRKVKSKLTGNASNAETQTTEGKVWNWSPQNSLFGREPIVACVACVVQS